jgi:hypothetical protein
MRLPGLLKMQRTFRPARIGVHATLTICLATCLALCLCACGDRNLKNATDAFNVYVRNYLDTYRADRHERVAFLGGGWVKEYFEVDSTSEKVDVQESDSTTYPYIGQLDFQMIRHYTAFHHQRGSALTDDTFTQAEVTPHRHNYIYQDGKWIPLADTDRDDSAP